ncbi:hypothetical protein AAFF_G00312870 [Aldrovandia affinis]|uniref:Hypoxia-inducible factor 1-alpha n=1 Tax=Aldrovandia affinis TaxID=143900 RepID=A0AAD7SNR7_9TELE|nr:hypothetical protein AAFF_G00312870 [Aldrovandia affinis]
MKERLNGVKKKRVCTEWHRARSRAAARSRREQESGLFGELVGGLPLPPGRAAHLDKTSIIRLTLSYLHLQSVLDTPDCTLEGTHPVQRGTTAQGCCFKGTSCVERVLSSALEGFLLLLSRGGRVIYTTEAVSVHTGIKQVDLIGQSLYDFMHPCDQKEAQDIFSSKAGVEQRQGCELFFRMRCTLTPQGRNINLKSAIWKVMHCTGVLKPCVSAGTGYLVLLCTPLPVPGAWEASLNQKAFLSRHRPDMRFTYCQSRVSQLTGYTEKELLGHSVYLYYHASDCQRVHKAHLSLFSKGQASTGRYRLLAKHGGYLWVETVATVIYRGRTGQPQSVICINYVLSEVEQSEVKFSLEQTECLLKPCSSNPALGCPSCSRAPPCWTSSAHKQQSQLIPVTTQLQDRAPGPEDMKAALMMLTTPHDTGQRSLEWNSKSQTQPTPQDLETLAPYIPMDGEDFLLSPISEVEGAALLFPNPLIQSPACLSPLLSNAPSWPSTSPGFFPPCSSAQTGMTENGSVAGRGCRQRSGQGGWDMLKRCRTGGPLSPGQHSQCGCHPWPPQHTVPHWKKLKVEDDSSYCTHCTPCWWGPVLVQSESVLPVLSRWECEVNAPLGPSSCLLRGSEILSVLDQATSQLHPRGVAVQPTVPPLSSPPLTPGQSAY